MMLEQRHLPQRSAASDFSALPRSFTSYSVSCLPGTHQAEQSCRRSKFIAIGSADNRIEEAIEFVKPLSREKPPRRETHWDIYYEDS